MGLGLVVTGVALLFLSTVRAERQVMTEKFDEMNKLLARNLGRLQFSSNGSTGGTATASQQVVAGKTVYHRAECKVLEGKEGMTTVTVQQAAAEDLSPCRVCDPPAMPKEAAKEPSDGEKATEGAATGSSS